MSKSFVFCFAILLFAASCAKKLEKVQAQEMIVSARSLPKVFSDKLQYGELRYMSGPVEQEEKLVNKNVISFDALRMEKTWLFNYVIYNLQLTLEGEKYKLGEFAEGDKTFYRLKLAEEVMGDITGIKNDEHDKTATVEYTTYYANITPFGEILGGGKYQEGKVINHTAVFALYDDGWRIIQNN